MKHSLSAETPDATVAGCPPVSVRVIRTLGRGRAARARLVEAAFADGVSRRCVEKVFAPGPLTRLIYRAAFQAPFAYQSNREAITACFYRRRVAAAVVKAAAVEAQVAEPLYVRYDRAEQAWVLAAAWVDGRGIRPAPADPQRVLGRLGRRRRDEEPPRDQPAEIDSLVALMHRLENLLVEAGLSGSGWQVAPRALVSTANLLRVGSQYTVIDLESGIPAVLVPRYVLGGLRCGALPPFDDLDAERLTDWYRRHRSRLRRQLGDDAAATLGRDVDRLIEHTRRWKESEPALARRPWRFFRGSSVSPYHREYLRRLQQSDLVDRETAAGLPNRPGRAALLWWAGWLPRPLGAITQRCLGHRPARRSYLRLWTDPQWRKQRWHDYQERCRRRWREAGRVPPQFPGDNDGGRSPEETASRRPGSAGSFLLHRMLEAATAAPLHRWLADRQRRRDLRTHLALLVLSPRYQRWFGVQQIESCIDRWQHSGRMEAAEAERLRSDLSAEEVRVYARGFGMHLALKALTPVIVPAKVGGAAAFLASGNLWFLLPVMLTPLLRTAVTLTSRWSTRRRDVPHGEALAVGLLPIIGSLAFPLQIFSTRRHLSTFLIREAASKIGRRIPVYGGTDSRTEIALIRMADWPVAGLALATAAVSSWRRRRTPGTADAEVTGRREAVSGESVPVLTRRVPATRLGRWLQRETDRRLDGRFDSPAPPTDAAILSEPLSSDSTQRRAA